jgi:hypothetical protein
MSLAYLVLPCVVARCCAPIENTSLVRVGLVSVSATVAALKDAYTDAHLFETIRGDELDDACTHELVHHILGTTTSDDRALDSFTRRKLKQHSI